MFREKGLHLAFKTIEISFNTIMATERILRNWINSQQETDSKTRAYIELLERLEQEERRIVRWTNQA